MHQLKYKGNKELGKQLGRLMGNDFKKPIVLITVDYLFRLPLFPSKEKKRGYNQATIFCEGIAEIMNVEILRDAITRTHSRRPRQKKEELKDGKIWKENLN